MYMYDTKLRFEPGPMRSVLVSDGGNRRGRCGETSSPSAACDRFMLSEDEGVRRPLLPLSCLRGSSSLLPDAVCVCAVNRGR